MALLEVKNLEVSFETPDGVVQAVNGMSFTLDQGETLAIVGESGAGKSQMVLAFMGLLAENGSVRGEALFHGNDLLKMKPRGLNGIRGKQIAMIFQDPMTSLNPFLTIEKQMAEVVMHHQGLRREEAKAHAVEMLRAVRIPDPEERIKQYPHEYSGGMRQRVMIAIGLLCEPELLIADEPSTALDVTVQAQITELVSELRKQTRMSLMLITHDLAAVAEVADRIIVMYAGEAVETGGVDDIFYRPQHPYTRGLLASVPRLDRASDDELQAIPGNPPNLQELPEGCRFRDRCTEAMEQCRKRPPLWVSDDGRSSRCFLPMEGGRTLQNATEPEHDE
ncbi:MAG: ABC transporter ATP-binding protein [Xanthomonadales bacterium]|nr:ABC transporter ATP-binding protein [Gammaproteobacteria bacterium]MBT8053526.1 ABC transporter ATP-binding protein [Gammaproteobacteria bacterium]NND57993.1 ABC transporter ATP-binding protein [Xanthomonadales bacterium]NNK50841.1 ABC transporter ATP-binding protein [Xanthomonadales bacterium]